MWLYIYNKTESESKLQKYYLKPKYLDDFSSFSLKW